MLLLVAGKRHEQHDMRQQALKILLDRHSAKLFRIIVRMGITHQLAEDILQEAFLKLWLKPEKFSHDKGSRLISWLTRLVMNLAIDYQRGNARKAETMRDDFASDHLEMLTDHSADYQQIQEQEIRQEIFLQAFAQLPAKQKQAINLCFFEDYSNQQAADIMGLKLKALQSLIVRGKQNMRDYAQAKQQQNLSVGEA